ncbi:MAG: type II toxin-antitoxin system VapC family toxin [Thermoguttaceae bacterium]|jgi:predicted nucleic acid-binding protein
MTPSLIIDCWITMAWCFADEATVETARVQDRLIAEAALVPSHWFLEVVNVLVMAEKHQRIAAADATNFLHLLATLDIQTDHETAARAFDHLPALCRSHGLTSYDAAYLDLAIRRRLPLASLDDDLRQAAIGLGIQVLGK